MLVQKFSVLKRLNLERLGQILFFFGIFFLCSSLFIGILFLLPAFLFSSFRNFRNKSYFKDKWNLSFFICGALIITNSLLQNFVLNNPLIGMWDPKLSLLGLINWIPFFWIFWAAQPYLDNSNKRRTFALTLIAGTLPLLITGIGQYFFGWIGPFKTLGGLVVWYLKPTFDGGLTGLFSNANYAGSWLNLIWPLCFAMIFENTKNLIKKSIAITFFLSIGTTLFLTYSRSSWGGLLLAIPLVIGEQSLTWIIPIILILFFFFFLVISNNIAGEFQSLMQSFIPEKFLLQFSSEGFTTLDVTRLEILKNALELIKISPWIGIGAGAFSVIFKLQTGFYKGHSHNLITELAISYGLPVSIIFFITTALLLIFSSKNIFFTRLNSGTNNYYERAFWAAIFFFFLSQNVDVQYFDGRISLLSWTYLALLRNIIREHKNLDASVISSFA